VTTAGVVRFHAAGVVELTAKARAKSQIVRVVGFAPPVADWSAAHDWATHQGDNRRSGHQPVTVDPREIEFLWGKSLGNGISWPATDGEVIYVSGVDPFGPSIRALTAATGSLVWLRRFGADSGTLSPALSGDRLVAQALGNPQGRLHLMDALTGADLAAPASYDDQWGAYYAPIVFDGTVYTGGGRYSGLYAYDRTTGALDWTAATPQESEWGPSLWNNELLFYLSTALSVVDRVTGAPLRVVSDPNAITSGPVSSIAVSSGGIASVIRWQRFVGFDLVSNTRLWQFGGSYRGHPATANGRVFVWNGGVLEARHEVTGALHWSFALESGFGVAVAATDNLIFATSTTTVYALDAATGLLVWTASTGGTIGIGDGVLMIGSSGGVLSVYALR